ncbi:DNA cytosine methyltransferase [[Eubacterium] hominis]|uniref:DNA cytosine methyltransferase n=1 Tax=[Eubacterium] hominis TaxID=2764325 RepID=UPI003A4E1B51
MEINQSKLYDYCVNDKKNYATLAKSTRIDMNVLNRIENNEELAFEDANKVCTLLKGNITEFVNKRKRKENGNLKVIELFAGAGGLALGLEKAGFSSLGLIELDKDASNTLKVNRPNWNVINDDIANISKLDLEELFNIKKGELDLLSGGSPCQSFSYAGKRLGLEDARGTLFYHYAKFLHKLQPKMFLFENVKGLRTHNKGRTYATILDIFEKEGYTIKKDVLNAWDYGVAQKRERLITIGIRNDLVDKINFTFPVPLEYKPVLRDVLLDCPKSDGAVYSEYKKKIFELVPPGGYWRDIPEEIAKKYMKSCWYMEGGRTGILRRLSLDEPSLTVLTSPSQKQTDRCHPLEARPFTVRENARCQSFPDEWMFCGSIGQQYKQVGNAVPVNLAYAVALKIKEGLEDL